MMMTVDNRTDYIVITLTNMGHKVFKFDYDGDDDDDDDDDGKDEDNDNDTDQHES